MGAFDLVNSTVDVPPQILYKMKVMTTCLLVLSLLSAALATITSKAKKADDTTKAPSRRLMLVPKTVYVPHYTSDTGGPYEAYLSQKEEQPSSLSSIFLAPAAAVASKLATSVQPPPSVANHNQQPPSYPTYPPYAPYSYPPYPSYPSYPPTVYMPPMPAVPQLNQYSSYAYFGVAPPTPSLQYVSYYPHYPAGSLDLQNPMSGYVGAATSVTGLYSSVPVPADAASAPSDSPATE